MQSPFLTGARHAEEILQWEVGTAVRRAPDLEETRGPALEARAFPTLEPVTC